MLRVVLESAPMGIVEVDWSNRLALRILSLLNAAFLVEVSHACGEQMSVEVFKSALATAGAQYYMILLCGSVGPQVQPHMTRQWRVSLWEHKQSRTLLSQDTRETSMGICGS